MIGVNSWIHDPGELKKVMIEHNITWRSFDDENDINRQWNFPATPAFFIIDHTGTIRHKWIGKPGENSVDTALDHLILAAENAPAK
jgi:peroxiredoxin